MACLQSKKGARPRSKKIARPRKVSTNMYTLLSSFYCLKDCRFPKKFPTKTPDYGRSARWTPNSPPDHDKVGKMKTKFIVRLQSDRSARWKPTSPPDHDENRIHRLISTKVGKVKTKFTARSRQSRQDENQIHRPITKRQVGKVKTNFTARPRWKPNSSFDFDKGRQSENKIHCYTKTH